MDEGEGNSQEGGKKEVKFERRKIKK